MKRVVYAGGAVVTGDEIAEAVLEYSRALAGAGRADTVHIPVWEPDRRDATAQLLIGPASQILAEPVPDDVEEITDADLVAHLRSLARGLDAPRARMLEDPPPEWPDLGA